ncbi:hypothetical protein LCGC14_2696960 [marine sediment metagenome]|uniref:Uncharacterized protein n=1 Tax=marine sediment metagenome TaxID=412755 RepID=A0A0F9BRB1_9ZZZZ
MFGNNRIVTKFYKSYYRFYKNKNNLKNIEKINNPILKIASKSIEQVIRNKITPVELKWVKGIKKLRDNLRKSTIEINFENYGAGTHIDSISLEKKGNKVIIKKTIGQICESTVLFKWGLLLFKIVKEFKPKICLELGTCIGISAAYQAAALEMNNQGKIYTIEGASSLVKLSENNLSNMFYFVHLFVFMISENRNKNNSSIPQEEQVLGLLLESKNHLNKNDPNEKVSLQVSF